MSIVVMSTKPSLFALEALPRSLISSALGGDASSFASWFLSAADPPGSSRSSSKLICDLVRGVDVRILSYDL